VTIRPTSKPSASVQENPELKSRSSASGTQKNVRRTKKNQLSHPMTIESPMTKNRTMKISHSTVFGTLNTVQKENKLKKNRISQCLNQKVIKSRNLNGNQK
jgi:hypothetical protein